LRIEELEIGIDIEELVGSRNTQTQKKLRTENENKTNTATSNKNN
jgi:hypothetical protein